MKLMSKVTAILLCIAMIAMTMSVTVFAAAPTINSTEMDPNNVRIRVNFSEGVYTNSDGTGGVTASDFVLILVQNGGAVSKAITSGPRTLQNADPIGGESSFFFYPAMTGGPASGVETIEIRPKDGTSVYNAAGEAMAASTTTGAINLFDKRVEFASGYPKAGNTQSEGSKQAQLVIYPLNETVTAYYVVVADGANAPSIEQVMAGLDSGGNEPLAKGIHANINTGGIDIAVILPEHAADYDAWVAIKDTAGNIAGPAKADLRTPMAPASNYVCEIVSGAKYATLDEALAVIANGQTIKLLDNINYDKGISITDGRSINFDLAGYTLNVVNNSGIGLSVENGGVNYNGLGAFNVTGTILGVRAKSAVAVVTNATATAEGGTGASASNGGDITINGNVQGGYYGAFAADAGSTIVVNGNATATTDSLGGGAGAGSGGSVTINGGTAKGVYYGANANGSGSLVTINGGDAIGTGPSSFGVHAQIGGTVNVTGNAQGMQYGVYSSDDTSVTVTGNVTATAQVNGFAVNAQSEGTIAVGGNVVANGSSLGAYVTSGGEITIDGAIMASNYISIFDTVSEQPVYKDGSASSQTIPTTKEGYFTYSAGFSTVWVKGAVPAHAVVTEMILDKNSLTQAGGKVIATVTGTSLNIQGTELKVSLDGGTNKIGTVTSNNGTVAVIEINVPENTTANIRTDTITLYLNGNATGHSAVITVAALQVPIVYTVSFDAQGGSSVPAISGIASGSTIGTPAEPVWAGHSFGGWYKEAACSNAWNFSTDTVTDNITLYAKWNVNLPATHTINVSANPSMGGSVSGAGTYSEGNSVTVTAVPNSGYRFINWKEGNVQVSTNAAYTFTMGMANRNLTANFEAVSSGYIGGWGGSSTFIPPLTAAQILESSGNLSSTVTPTLDSSTGILSVKVGSVSLNSAFDKSAADDKGVKTVVVNIPKIDGAKAYETALPVSFFSAGDAAKAVEIKTNIGTVKVPGNMLNRIDISVAQNVSLTIATVDKSKLAANVQSQIGNRPIIELSLRIDGKQTAWDNDSVPVTVSIPYTPTTAELQNPEHIVIWYIDGSGNPFSISNGRYDSATGTVIFTTTHFSYYAIVYMYKTFSDLGSVEWAKKPIEVLASKGILKGRSETEYAPQTNITRAEYLYFLVRTLGVEARVDGNFDDIDKNAYYYKEIGIAKKLGITTGTGNNKFEPDADITRQDMMVLTARTLERFKALKAADDITVLGKFSDKGDIANYAAISLATLVKEDLITGSGDKVNPHAYTTRAEAAVFLYRIYNK